MTQWLRPVARLTPTSMPWRATPVYHFVWLSRDYGKEQLYKYSPSNLPNIFNNPQVDAGLHSIITNLEATQPAWDSSLCPTARSSLNKSDW